MSRLSRQTPEPLVTALLVEDHPDVAEMMLLMLESLGCEATHARSVADATAKATQTAFDLLILDYRLPDGDGLEVLRQTPEGQYQRAVLLTGFGSDIPKPKPGTPQFEVMAKPVSMEQLKSLLQSIRSNGRS